MRRSDWVIVGLVLLGTAAVLVIVAIVVANFIPTQSAAAIATVLVAVSTLALAALTAVLLVLNNRILSATLEAVQATKESAVATRDEAEATREEATATREQAEATKEQAETGNESLREIRRSRELDWRPFLVRVDLGETSGNRVTRNVTIQNIGRGPALNCLYVREEETPEGRLFLKSDPINLASGGETFAVEAREQGQAAYPALFQRNEFPRELLLCQDQFGSRYRFTPGYPSVATWALEEWEGGEDEPGWSRAMEEMLYARHPFAEPPPDPGYFFLRAVNVNMPASDCFTTIALEAVPLGNDEPDDEAEDMVQEWMKSLNPDITRKSPTTPHWRAGDDWDGWLWAGPGLSVREVVSIDRAAGEASQEARLRLREAVDRWRQVIDGGLTVLRQLGSQRVRLGLTLVTWGVGANPYRITDLRFHGLPTPNRWITPDQIDNWRHLMDPIDSTTFPQQALSVGVRRLLRNFGYREVDEVIAALNL